MIWRFALEGPNQPYTVIDEPIGWADMGQSLRRNLEHHGVFQTIDTSDLEYIGNGFTILQTEYNARGADGEMNLWVDYKCEGDVNWSEFYYGKFDFQTFARHCGDDCWITCTVTNSRCADILLGRLDQRVKASAVENFDGQPITPLQGDNVNVRGQEIVLQNNATVDLPAFYGGGLVPYPPLQNVTPKRFYIPILFDKDVVGDVGFWNLNTGLDPVVYKNDFSAIDFSDPDEWAEYGFKLALWERGEPDNVNCVYDWNDPIFDFKIEGEFTGSGANPPAPGDDPQFYSAWVKLAFYNQSSGYINTIVSHPIGSGSCVGSGTTLQFSYSFFNTPLLYGYSHVLYWIEVWLFDGTPVFPSDPDTFIGYALNNFTPGGETEDVNYFKLTWNTFCPPTKPLGYRLDKLLAWLPTAYVETDCFENGSTCDVECFQDYHIFNGLLLRLVTTPVPAELYVSFDELFRGASRIFNVGWGLFQNETEVRVSSLPTFYADRFVLDLGAVFEAEFTNAEKMVYGLIKIGYSKWELGEYTGLDEMNTRREYRRNVKNQMTALDLLSDLIAGGYTIETTRRRNQNVIGTADNAFDNDLFILNTFLDIDDDQYYDYRGVDVGPSGITTPATRLNYRLTPVRNLLRWFKTIAAGNPNTASESLLFNSADGNYLSAGQMNSSVCDLENQIIKEDQTITESLFIDPTDASPLWETIIIKLTGVPCSISQWNLLKSDPYGYVRFTCGGTLYQGWVIEATQTPNEGTADFTLLKVRQNEL